LQLLGNSGADLFKPNIEEQLKDRVKVSLFRCGSDRASRRLFQ
jgi:hypothetical protein